MSLVTANNRFSVLDDEQTAMIRAALQGMDRAEGTAFLDTIQEPSVAPSAEERVSERNQQTASQATRVPLRKKGKGIDPRNFGNLPSEDLDVDDQNEAYSRWQELACEEKREMHTHQDREEPDDPVRYSGCGRRNHNLIDCPRKPRGKGTGPHGTYITSSNHEGQARRVEVADGPSSESDSGRDLTRAEELRRRLKELIRKSEKYRKKRAYHSRSRSKSLPRRA
jgi:hypothetical protein